MKDRFNRDLFEIVCSSCGKSDFVPFSPREGAKVFCKGCYREMKEKGIR